MITRLQRPAAARPAGTGVADESAAASAEPAADDDAVTDEVVAGAEAVPAAEPDAGDEAELRMVFSAAAWPDPVVADAGLLVSSVTARAPPPASSAASAIPAPQRNDRRPPGPRRWPPAGPNCCAGQLSCGSPLGG